MVNALSKPPPPWGYLYKNGTPDHGKHNVWFGCTEDRKRLKKILKLWSSGDVPADGDNLLTIDCTGYRHGIMTEYSNPD
eukprot:7529424-Karenia_brevis.AAC.1